jgi:predicted nucleotidyltransferase
MTPSHHTALDAIIAALRNDPRIVGAAAGGSYASAAMDDYSDLDLVIAVEPNDYTEVMAARKTIAATLGQLLSAFTGEHVGEPRLLICLYESPLMHVDLKFVSLDDAGMGRVEDPVVVWERDGRLSAALRQGTARYPEPNPQWIEDRFWIWTHYCASKIGRGELFEALDFLAFIRSQVLGPLALIANGARPSGVRKIEMHAPEFAAELEATIAQHTNASCLAALEAAVGLYLELRTSYAGAIDCDEHTRVKVMEYLAEVGTAIQPL